MKGAGHDQLHVVLHSIQEDAKALSEVSDPHEGHRIVEETLQHVQLFYDFFENP